MLARIAAAPDLDEVADRKIVIEAIVEKSGNYSAESDLTLVIRPTK